MDELGPIHLESNKKTYEMEMTRGFSRQTTKVHDYNKHSFTIYSQERDTTNHQRKGAAGTKTMARGAYYVTKVHAKPTLRQIKQRKTLGIANPQVKKGAYNLQKPVFKPTLREMSMTSYTPGGGKQRSYTGSDEVNVRLANKLSNMETQRVLSRSRTIEKVPDVNNFGLVTKHRKDTNNLNIQYDPSILSQLKSNPFVI